MCLPGISSCNNLGTWGIFIFETSSCNLHCDISLFSNTRFTNFSINIMDYHCYQLHLTGCTKGIFSGQVGFLPVGLCDLLQTVEIPCHLTLCARQLTLFLNIRLFFKFNLRLASRRHNNTCSRFWSSFSIDNMTLPAPRLLGQTVSHSFHQRLEDCKQI